MSYEKLLWRGTVVALSLFLAISGNAAQPPHKTQPTKAATNAPAYQAGLEPRAIEILKASSARLAAAKSMAFTAVVSYESPSRLGPPLVYSTQSRVLMQRPDKLRVITLADGPRTEFFYDGKTMTAFAVPENLVAVADAPPTIDAALKVAYDTGAIYFPFTDVIVADPYKDLSEGLKIAFYIGQSEVVGGVPTDMVAYVTGDVFIQIWIGTDDKLPRRVYAIYLNDPLRLRHVLELSDWTLDGDVPANAFVSDNTSGATRIAFARPDATDAPGMKPPPKSKPSKAQ
ncbi:DUF2092 domain-containing protein [Burkholderia sp. L27(2015)]|uniref:DUF2092 domain-containing protein n=1 Tax=Burkholderia sp. L27(2015) TaxID=1641858 RepID=UPI00131A99AD|nr:DUF2092 domain-containing protein [Burkholderia sp. L27(2015)]